MDGQNRRDSRKEFLEFIMAPYPAQIAPLRYLNSGRLPVEAPSGCIHQGSVIELIEFQVRRGPPVQTAQPRRKPNGLRSSWEAMMCNWAVWFCLARLGVSHRTGLVFTNE